MNLITNDYTSESVIKYEQVFGHGFPDKGESTLMKYSVEIWQHQLELESDPALFSPRQADAGTLAMLSKVELRENDCILDLGCGVGLVGLAAASVLKPEQVVMVDIDPLATSIARRNADQLGLSGVRIITGDGPAAAAPEIFSLILCNPPYHTDFSVARRFIEQSWRQLAAGGRLFLVVKRLAWYQNKLTSTFGGVRVWQENGYYVLMSEKRASKAPATPEGHQKTQTTRKHSKKLAQSRRLGAANRTVPAVRNKNGRHKHEG